LTVHLIDLYHGGDDSDEDATDLYTLPFSGFGKSNFLPPWEVPSINVDYDSPPGKALYIPYHATPQMFLREDLEDSGYTRVLQGHEKGELNRLFSGLWTLPPDWRLDLDFQNHVLREWKIREPTKELLDHARTIRNLQLTLLKLGGSYEIEELGSSGTRYTYQIFDSPEAVDVEEWFISIPPKKFAVTKNLLPRSVISYDSFGKSPNLPWRRLML